MYKSGVILPPKPDERDWPVSSVLPVSSKHERSYRLPGFKENIPVYDQDIIDSCLAHALCVEREYTEWQQTGKYVPFSKLFIYGNRVQGDYMGPGLIPDVTFRRTQDRGVPPYELLPGNVEVPEAVRLFNEALSKVIGKAKPQRITGRARARSIAEIKSAIRAGRPVIAVSRVYEERYHLTKENPVMTDNPKGESKGLHGTVLWGWDDDIGSGCFDDRNSWGKKWANDGDGYLPYSQVVEAWILFDDLYPAVRSTKYNRANKKVVIHHLGDNKGPEEDLTSRWNPHGYDYPAYDWGINGDGRIIQGRPLSYEGAHAKATYEEYTTGQYYDSEDNWWNRNSIGVVLSGDFTITSLPDVMFDSLVNLLVKLIKDHNLKVNDVLPHSEITATACPGTSFGWSWDKLIKALNDRLEVEEVLDDLVIYADGDTGTALIQSQDLGCPMVHTKDAHKYQAKNKHWIGVHGIDGNGNYYYFGANRKETAKQVLL